MKSIIFYTSLILLLLVSSVAFSDIKHSFSGNGGNTDIEAYASGSTTSDYTYESGWYYEYTDTEGWFNWSYGLSHSTNAYGELMLGEWASGVASSEALVGGPVSDSSWETSSFFKSGDYDNEPIEAEPEGDPDPEGPNATGEGESHFYAYEGIYIEVQGLARAEIEEGSGCWAYAHVYSSSSCSMW